MKEFEAAKANLLSELEIAIRQNPEERAIITLLEMIKKINLPSELDGGLSKIVVDSLDFRLKVAEKVITFENFFLNKTG